MVDGVATKKILATIDSGLEGVTKGVMERAGVEIGRLVKQETIDRTMKRQDVTGRRLPPVSKTWRKRKAKIIAGKARYRRRKGRYKAEGVNDTLRVSGWLLRQLRVKNVRVSKRGAGGMKMTAELGWKSDEAEQQALGLITGKLGKSRGPQRRFLGPPSPSSQPGKLLHRAIAKRVAEIAKVEAVKGFKLMTR